MPNGEEIQRTLTQPLAFWEEAIRAPAQAIRQGVQQLNTTAHRSGLPQNARPSGAAPDLQ